jgi:hypothetical protein
LEGYRLNIKELKYMQTQSLTNKFEACGSNDSFGLCQVKVKLGQLVFNNVYPPCDNKKDDMLFILNESFQRINL